MLSPNDTELTFLRRSLTYNSLEQPACMAWNFLNLNLVGGAITILKNDGVRQWGWGYPIYEMEVIKFHGSKPPTRIDHPYHHI